MLGIHRSQLCKNPTVCDSWKEEACCTGLLFPRACIRGIFILFDKEPLQKGGRGANNQHVCSEKGGGTVSGYSVRTVVVVQDYPQHR